MNGLTLALLVVVEGGEGLLRVVFGDALGHQPALEGVDAHGFMGLGLGHATGVLGVVDEAGVPESFNGGLDGGLNESLSL